MTRAAPLLPEHQLGPAERLLDVVLSSSAHLWHNRPGFDVGGAWHPARGKGQRWPRGAAKPVKPGLFVPAAVALYGRLLEIYLLNPLLMAHFASYALAETEWRDLKVACAALMLVQRHAGEPVKDDDGSVAFRDDDYRSVGEAMLLRYEKKSTRMMTPKAILRVAELLEAPEIAALNRKAGFGEATAKKAPLGRWRRAAEKWLRLREANLPMLSGLVRAGYKETIKKIARKCGYAPETQAFFEVLGWKQKQSKGGHRKVGLKGLALTKSERWEGLSEAEICEAIVDKKLSYKEAVGRLPKDVGLTPAILAALLPSLSDRDLRILTPTLEELGLLGDAEIYARWSKAIDASTDQRALHVAKNVRSKAVRDRLEDAADAATRSAVAEATKEDDVRVFFLVDKSGSMEGAIEKSKEALTKILAGFPLERVHCATFDTMGTVLVPKAASRAAVSHLFAKMTAAGGTMHMVAVRALAQAGVTVPKEAKLVVIVVGDEAGEPGATLAKAFSDHGYGVGALALLVNVAPTTARGSTVRDCARALQVPFAEVTIEQLDDPYQVPRVLRALLEAPVPAGTVGVRSAWVEKVMKTPLLAV